MNDNRRDILASFCARENGKHPTRQGDFLQRALRTEGLARWQAKPGAKSNDDLDAGEQFAMSAAQEALDDEAEAMVEEGLLMKPRLTDLPEWKSPPGVYQLTPKGATAAAAVLKQYLAAQKEGTTDGGGR